MLPGTPSEVAAAMGDERTHTDGGLFLSRKLSLLFVTVAEILPVTGVPSRYHILKHAIDH